ncbi:MAG: DUF3006 domain-containing protein [Clostridia bacterium]|nr:DUF3006 domain-containing protein [Clostridia bacterium]
MRAVVDRFEGDQAILLFGEDEFQVAFPRDLLPEDTREGSWLNVNFELDTEGSEKQKEKISGLLDKLKNKHR